MRFAFQILSSGWSELAPGGGLKRSGREGVGFDIACGNLAIRTDAMLSQIEAAVPRIMDDVVRDISFGIGRKAKVRVEHELFDDRAWELRLLRDLKSLAAEQLGTVGGGNHYVDLFADEEDRIWVEVHFGSRGLGHRTGTHRLKAAGGQDGVDAPPTVVDDSSSLGQDYLAGMPPCMPPAGLCHAPRRKAATSARARNEFVATGSLGTTR